MLSSKSTKMPDSITVKLSHFDRLTCTMYQHKLISSKSLNHGLKFQATDCNSQRTPSNSTVGDRPKCGTRILILPCEKEEPLRAAGNHGFNTWSVSSEPVSPSTTIKTRLSQLLCGSPVVLIKAVIAILARNHSLAGLPFQLTTPDIP